MEVSRADAYRYVRDGEMLLAEIALFEAGDPAVTPQTRKKCAPEAVAQLVHAKTIPWRVYATLANALTLLMGIDHVVVMTDSPGISRQ